MKGRLIKWKWCPNGCGKRVANTETWRKHKRYQCQICKKKFSKEELK